MRNLLIIALAVTIAASVVEAQENNSLPPTADEVKQQLKADSAAISSRDALNNLLQSTSKDMVDSAKSDGLSVPDDPESLADGLWSESQDAEKVKRLLNEAAENKLATDPDGRINEAFTNTKKQFDRPSIKINKDSGLEELAEAAEDLMQAKKNGENREIAIGGIDLAVAVKEDRSCSYSELSKKVTYTCVDSVQYSCASSTKGISLKTLGIILKGKENSKGSWSFSSPDNSLPARDAFYEDNISFSIEELARVSSFRLDGIKFEDQLQIQVNGTFIFRGIGPRAAYYSTTNESTMQAWSYSTTQLDYFGPAVMCPVGGDSSFSGGPQRPEVHWEPCDVQPSGPTVRGFTHFGDQSIASIDVLRHLKKGSNTISFKLAVGNDANRKPGGDISVTVNFLENCSLTEVVTPGCPQESKGLIEVKPLSARTCTGGPAMIMIGGKSTPHGCSAWSQTFEGRTSPVLLKSQECADLRPPFCIEMEKKCERLTDLGCEIGKYQFECRFDPPKTSVTMSTKDVMECFEGGCVTEERAQAKMDVTGLTDVLKAESVTDCIAKEKASVPGGILTEAQAAKINEECEARFREFNDQEIRFFSGEPLTCGKALAFSGLRDCCSDSGLLSGITRCQQGEMMLAMSKKQNLAFKIGSYSSGNGLTKRKHEAWCSYDSLISKIIAEHIFRTVPVDVGRKGSWSCRFITPEMIQNLDFDQVDFTPLKESLANTGSNQEAIGDLKMQGSSIEDFEGSEIEKLIEEKIKDRFRQEVSQ